MINGFAQGIIRAIPTKVVFKIINLAEQIVCAEDLCIKQIDMFNLRHIILCAYFYVNKYKTNYQKSIDILIYYAIISIS